MPSRVSEAQCVHFPLDFVCFVSGDIELIHRLLFLYCLLSQEQFQPSAIICPSKT